MNKSLTFLIFNFVGLQITWAACAYGATHAMPLLGVYIGFSYIILHFIFSDMRLRDLKIMCILGVSGILIDFILTQISIVSFPPSSPHYDFRFLSIPLWLMSLWFVFSLMIPYSLYWLKKNLKIACIAGAIGGSFSYFLGHYLGALQLAEPLMISVGIYIVIWGIIFPLALKIVEYFTQTNLNTNTAFS